MMVLLKPPASDQDPYVKYYKIPTFYTSMGTIKSFLTFYRFTQIHPQPTSTFSHIGHHSKPHNKNS